MTMAAVQVQRRLTLPHPLKMTMEWRLTLPIAIRQAPVAVMLAMSVILTAPQSVVGALWAAAPVRSRGRNRKHSKGAAVLEVASFSGPDSSSPC